MFTKILCCAILCYLHGTDAVSSRRNFAHGKPTLYGRLPAEGVQRVVQNTGRNDVCFTRGCLCAAKMVRKNMDRKINPCDDFYKFACGGFIESTHIPDDKVSISTLSMVTDKLHEQLRQSMEGKSELNERKPSRLVKSLYKSCMNTTAIEAQGLVPLREILKKLGGWPVIDGDQWNESDFNWTNSIYKFRSAGYSVSYFIDFGIESDLINGTKRVIYLDQADIGLPREYLLDGFDNKIVEAYRSYMVDVAVILGAEEDRAKAELKESLLFEMKLADISLPNEARRNVTQLYNPMTLNELTKSYPSVPWRQYFGHLLPPTISIEENEILIVSVPSYISKFEKLIAITPKRVQANYVMWRAVAASVRYLNDVIRNRQLAYATAQSGQKAREPRWKECVRIVSEDLSISVGAMYVKKYFNKEAKKNAVEMVMDLREQFKMILQEVKWMDEETRQSALHKAAAMSSHVAYPDELLNDKKLEELYEKLELSAENYLEDMLNLTRFITEYSFSQLRKPVNKNDWTEHGSSAVINAFYSPTENSIELPAGILQGALFSNDRPRFMNYGAIGFIIGHEITHGFDDQGRQLDKDGNLVDWWAPATKEKYLERAQCIIHQYGNYTIKEVGVNLNGIITQGENIADNGGIKEAYRAYNSWVERNAPEKKLPCLPYTPKQMFWISMANVWCSKFRPEVLQFLIAADNHSPDEFRVLGSLSNMPEFSKDFNCPIGSKMNPKKKCSVW